jgi:hypothetical protein
MFYSLIRKAAKPPKSKRPRRQVTDTYARQSKLSVNMARAINIDLFRGIETFKKEIPKDKIAEAWAAKNYHGIREWLPWSELPGHLEKSLGKIGAAATGSGEIQLEILPPNVNKNLRFDLSNPFLKKFVEDRKTVITENITASGQAAVNQVIQESFTVARTPRQIAEQIKDSVGLLPAHQIAVDRYRMNLLANGASEDKANAQAAQYAGRLLDYRTKMIARTESRMAVNQGQILIWQEGMRQGYISKMSQKVWVVDGDPCEICLPMDGQSVPVDEPWQVDFGKEGILPIYNPTETHPHCMCGMELTEIENPDEVGAALTASQNEGKDES